MNIYLEQILIVLGVVSLLLAAIFCFYLALSKRKSKMYKKIIDDDTTEVLSLMQETEEFWKDGNKSIDLEKTELITEQVSYTEFISSVNNPTEVISKNVLDSRFKPIEDTVLEGKYVIEKELGGGGMSRVYLARHKKLGNRWVIKHIDNKMSFLANEEHILKRLNHINLPKIVDIFHDDSGMYIVETYIEGISLDKILASGRFISPALALDFAEQFVMVLNYLHSLKPHPIIHCDLKPSNIIITPDNKLVLIDFGISKLSGQDEKTPMAATYRYAAPEQLKKNVPDKYKGLVSIRFGDAAQAFFQGNVDERTDMFSMGAILFEMISGQIPTVTNRKIIKEYISDDFYKIIYKCIQTDPDDRYNSADEVRHDLQNVRISKVSMLRSLLVRRAVFLATVFLFALSFSAIASGTYLIQLENGSVVTVYPDSAVVSMKQSTEIQLEKIFENGNINSIGADEVVWNVKDDSIATVMGNKIIGVKQGSTIIDGTYKDKKIKIKVNVTDKVEDQAEVSLKYVDDYSIQKWCGDPSQFESVDGTLQDAAFCVPNSIAQMQNGDIYISDGGKLRKISGEEISTINTQLPYAKADILKAFNDELFILSDVWYDDGDKPVYGLFKLTNDNYTLVAQFDAENTNITDFAVDDEYLYYAISIPYADSSSLTRFNLSTGESEVLCGLDYNIDGICVDNDTIYLSTYDEVMNYAYIFGYDVELRTLNGIAGVENMRNFVDSSAIQCFAPTSLQYYNGELYFFDYNVLRKITFDDSALTSSTVVGIPSVEFNDKIIDETPIPSDEVILSDMNCNFLVTDNGILITDKYNGYILKVDKQ